MYNVNFWNEIATLYINDIPCSVRKVTTLSRGAENDAVRHYKDNERICHIFTHCFGLMYSTTLFKQRPYYIMNPFWDDTVIGESWQSVTHNTNKLFEKDIKSVRVELKYTTCDKVTMKQLLDYPADLVVEYLKERGITSCPLTAE